jgi:hypothetical protein
MHPKKHRSPHKKLQFSAQKTAKMAVKNLEASFHFTLNPEKRIVQKCKSFSQYFL